MFNGFDPRASIPVAASIGYSATAVALTLGVITASGVGETIRDGSGNPVLPSPLTTVGTGKIGRFASSAATLPTPMVTSATGERIVTSAPTITLGSMTVSGLGERTVDGAQAFNLPSPFVVFAGDYGVGRIVYVGANSEGDFVLTNDGANKFVLTNDGDNNV